MPLGHAEAELALHGLEVSIAATLAAILYPVIRFVRPQAATISGAFEAEAPYRVDELDPMRRGAGPHRSTSAQTMSVIRTPDGKVRAFFAVCTLLECTVEFRAAKADIFCNCHNSIYNLNSRNVSARHRAPSRIQGDAAGNSRTGEGLCLPNYLIAPRQSRR